MKKIKEQIFFFLFLFILCTTFSYAQQYLNISFNMSKFNFAIGNDNLPNKTTVIDNYGKEWEINFTLQQSGFNWIKNITEGGQSIIRYYRNSDSYDGLIMRLIDRNNVYKLTSSSVFWLDYQPYNYVLSSGMESKRTYGLVYINKTNSIINAIFNGYTTSAYNGYGSSCVLSTLLGVGYSTQQIINSKPSCVLTTTHTYEDFNSIQFYFWGDHEGANNQNATIYRIELLNVLNGTTPNQLPNGTIYSNYTQYCENPTGKTEIPLYSTFIDPENDTIMYSVNEMDFLTRIENYQEDFLDETTGLGDFNIFLRNQFIIDNTTGYYSFGNLAILKILYPNNWISLTKTENNPMLTVAGGTKPFKYQINTSSNVQSTYYSLFGFPYNDTTLHLSALNDQEQKFINITFQQTTEGNFTITINNEFSYNKKMPTFNSNYENYFDLTLMFQPEEHLVKVYIANLEEDLYLTTISNDFSNFKSIEYDSRNSTNLWLMDYLSIKTWNTILTPVFSNELKQIFINESGTYILKILVSDNYNQPTSYVSVDLPITLYSINDPKCQEIKIERNETQYINETKENPFMKIITPYKPIFKTYYESIGGYYLGEYLLWFVWLILFIILISWQYLTFRDFALTMPFIVSSICVLVVSILLSYTTTLMVMLLILGFGIAGPLSQYIMGEKKNG